MKTQILKLADIRCDSGTQCRSGVSEETVSDYAERMQSGDSFPPVVLFFDGNEYHMADGFHRYLAASRNGSDELPAVLHQGTAQDALWYGLGSNRVNGLRLSPGDKRRAVELALRGFRLSGVALEGPAQQLASDPRVIESYLGLGGKR